jgi:nitrogen regulatory protein PII
MNKDCQVNLNKGDIFMKLVKVILRPEKEFELKDVLSGLGYHGITSKDSAGFGESKKVVKQVYRGKVYEQRVDAIKRKELEFVVPDDRVEKVVETIRKIAVTSQGGDGRIYISTLDDSIHIHTGDKHFGDTSEEGLEKIV